MSLEMISFDGMILDEFHPEKAKGLYPGFSRTVEAVYMIGKTPEWGEAQKKDAIRGVLTQATTRDKTKHLYGRFLIDVKACAAFRSMSLSLGGGSKSSPIDFYQLKNSVLKTFIHESFHVVQAWHAGGMKYLLRRKAKYAEKIKDTREGASYLSNPIEKAAFERERIVGRDMIKKLNEGKYDKLLSLKILNQFVESSKK